ncbi:hypothetical protein [Jidongwangia harbinensis]|uniref:hypothetical protein n=1 Tax=Jidongwangia harbinensis TaxID=2878561 RepID=UPI001CDA47AD|nr:hypothetical protein [Jidongwangia harbinensis]MCA2218018.1 hypothetical protein [Jidongwangia harbinensis]
MTDQTYQLLLQMGPTVALPVPRELADALQAVQVTTSAGQPSGFQLTFAVSKTSVINTRLLPAGFFDPKIRVIVTVIVNGSPTVLIDGVITRHELTVSDQPGATTLTVTGEDLTLVMDLEHVRTCHPAQGAATRVAAICAKYFQYGIIPAPVPPVLLDIPNPVERIPVQAGTDLAYIRALADECGYVFYLEPGPAPGTSIAYWGPEVRVGVPQPALSVNLDAATNVESLSFTFDGQAREQMVLDIVEPNTKQIIKVPIPDIGLLRPPLAARPSLALRQRPVPNVAHLAPLTAALLGLAQTAQASDAISGQGQLDVLRYGHILQARRLVAVRGAGVAYDGLYFVASVTHDLRRGRYTQNFSLSRDGLIPLIPRVIT